MKIKRKIITEIILKILYFGGINFKLINAAIRKSRHINIGKSIFILPLKIGTTHLIFSMV